MTNMNTVPINDLVLVAELRLMNDPRITSYTFENGVEQRTFASTFIKLNETLKNIVNSFEEMTDAIDSALALKANAFSRSRD